MSHSKSSFVKSAVVVAASFTVLALAPSAHAEDPNVTRGRAEIYKQLPVESLETVSTSTQISKLDAPNVAPTTIWKVLEHGEKVECLACVPKVSKLLYNSHPKTREIAAWWLRRRIFGVFGPGQVYEQTLNALGNASETESHRVYAANALGEFLSLSGVPALSKAVLNDESPQVRLAAVGALERLNSTGADGELAHALSDGDEQVRLAALHGATHVNTFTDVEAVVALIGDSSSLVRRRAAETLGVMKAADAVAGLMVLAAEDQESDAQVRAAAVWALGQIGDPVAGDVILAARNDSDASVRSAAKVSSALLRL